MSKNEVAASEQPTRLRPQIGGTVIGAVQRLAGPFARIALGAAFLSAVADRFGLWGLPGNARVAWGDFAHFTRYVGMVNSFLPAAVIPTVAWVATAAEVAFGVGLIIGIYKRAVALGSAVLLLLFALAMTISFGVKAPLDASVFSASAAAFLLFAGQQRIWGKGLDGAARSGTGS